MEIKHTQLKYCIFGAGAIGGCMGAFLADAGKDVTFIARGETLKNIQEKGIEMHTPHATYNVPVKAVAEADYHDTPDVVIVGVKVYAIDSVIPFLDRVCTKDTVVLPLENALDFGAVVQAKMKTPCVMCSGEAYVAVVQLGPGVIKQKLPFYRVIFAPRDGVRTKRLWKVRQDMLDAGMASELDTDPIKIGLRKFVRVSTLSAICCYFDVTLGAIRENQEIFDMFVALCGEICQIAEARGNPFEDDAVEDALTTVLTGPKEYKTSMKYDMDNGRPMEVQTQFFDVYEMGRKLGLEMPAYKKVSEKFGYQGGL